MIKQVWNHYHAVIAYLFFGVLTTLVNIGSFALFNVYLHWQYQIANVVAWIITVLLAYFTNKVWVFNSKYTTTKALVIELFHFIVFRLLTLLLEIIIMYVGISLLRQDTVLVKIIDNVIVVIANYLFSKWFIFKAPND